MGGGKFHLFFISTSLLFIFFQKRYDIGSFGWVRESHVYFFRVCRNLTIKETMEVTSLLALVEGCSFREGRRDVCVFWNRNPS